MMQPSTAARTSPIPSYRPDIDGLRAIAVLAVLIHHLQGSWLPGGFVGVDIFFVISGYLITSLLYKDISNGQFSLRQFYKRRINRIAPALFCVIFVSSVAAAFLLSPTDLIRMAWSAVTAFVGFSNVYIWTEYGNYFSAGANEAPLLHTWSLGVEEQFYMIWPLLLYFGIKLTRRWTLPVLALLTLGAILLSDYATARYASASYYLLPTRFFELMMGAWLAIATPRLALSQAWLRHALRLLGLLMIGYSLFFIDKFTPFPGLFAVIPCAGTLLLIWAGINDSQPPLLASRPLVGLGLISYSLYLWHWPLIAYCNYLYLPTTGINAVLIVIVALLLSWLTWRYVETPFRRHQSQLSFGRVFSRRFVLPAAVLAGISALYVGSHGLPQRFDQQVMAMEQNLATRPNELRSACHVPNALYATQPDPSCLLGATDKPVTGILIGDSFANHSTAMLDLMAKADGIALMDYTMDGCSPILDQYGADTSIYEQHCQARNQFVYDYLEKHHFDYVVLGSAWPDSDKIVPRIEESLRRIQKTGAKLIVIQTNEHIEHAATCPIRKEMFGLKTDCSVENVPTRQYWTQIRQDIPGIHFIDPNQAICNEQRCSPVLGQTLLYRDEFHLNNDGSRAIGERLLQEGITLLRPQQQVSLNQQ